MENPESTSSSLMKAGNRKSNSIILMLYTAAIFLTIITAFAGPYYHYNWTNEYTMFTIGTVLQLFFAGVLAFNCYQIVSYHKRNGGGV